MSQGWPALKIENDPHAPAYCPHGRRVELAHALSENSTVDSDDLRDVGNRIPGETGTS